MRARRLLVAAVLLVAGCAGGASHVDRITIVNGTPYNVDVRVSGGDADAWHVLAHVPRGREVTVEQVVDQGETWVFAFDHRRDEVAQLRRSRSELEQARWRVEVPDDVRARLVERGVAESIGTAADPSPGATEEGG